MASFAKIENNIVVKVESVVNEVLKDSNGVEQEQLGINFLRTLYNEPNAIWKQTSYNTQAGVHKLNGTPFRKNFAGVGYTYISQFDAFVPPQPYNSWVLNEDTCTWEAPIPYPETYTKNLVELDGSGNPRKDPYIWNELTLNWDLTQPKIN